ncbi:MAG: hypothetical protein WCS31_18345 [Verrucomicrobiae bacterium]
MKIVFCGTGEIGLPAFLALADSPAHELAGVITQPDRPAGRDLKPRPPEHPPSESATDAPGS